LTLNESTRPEEGFGQVKRCHGHWMIPQRYVDACACVYLRVCPPGGARRWEDGCKRGMVETAKGAECRRRREARQEEEKGKGRRRRRKKKRKKRLRIASLTYLISVVSLFFFLSLSLSSLASFLVSSSSLSSSLLLLFVVCDLIVLGICLSGRSKRIL
jgi:hypothetical protein